MDGFSSSKGTGPAWNGAAVVKIMRLLMTAPVEANVNRVLHSDLS
jgi:hypothetical protein